MASTDKPQILLLSLSYLDFIDETYSALFDKLLETAFKAILITDQGLTESNPETQQVRDKVKAYIENGGLAIVGLHFPNFTTMDQFDDFFAAFGLPWKRGYYHRTTFQRNPAGFLPDGIAQASLPGPYSMKVLHVQGADPRQKLYVPVEGAVTQSLVMPPEVVNRAQAAVTGARLGRGSLIYCGDVNGEDGSNQLMLALCGF